MFYLVSVDTLWPGRLDLQSSGEFQDSLPILSLMLPSGLVIASVCARQASQGPVRGLLRFLFLKPEKDLFPNSACSAGDIGDSGSIPELGRSPGVGKGNPCQSPYLENPMGRAWRATV